MHTLVVACGTYDGSVFSLQYAHDEINPNGPTPLQPCFVDPTAHVGAVTSLALKQDVVVSGGKDETIQVFSVGSRCRLGSLDLHTGTVQQLEFSPDNGKSSVWHLFSASDDGCIAIWRRSAAKDQLANPSSWECIRILRRHKGPVQSMSVHRSGRCAYSISEDKTLRVWNLMRGRQAYATRLKTVADGAHLVLSSPSGRRLLFGWPDRFDVIDLPTSESEAADPDNALGYCLGSVRFPQPLTAAPVFFSEDDFDVMQSNENGQKDLPQYLYLLSGFGSSLQAFRCSLSRPIKSQSVKPEAMGELRLPGKRIKVIRVTDWPQALRETQPSLYGFRSRLVTVVTTEAGSSHLRGYAVNFGACAKLEVGSSFIPVFTHDVSFARVTALAVDWLCELKIKKEDDAGDVILTSIGDSGQSESDDTDVDSIDE